MFLGHTTEQWLWLTLSVLMCVIVHKFSYWWGVQFGLDLFSKKLDGEIDKRLRWYLEKK
jgi:hypothetical protein